MAYIDIADYFEFDASGNRLILKKDTVLCYCTNIIIGTVTLSDGGDIALASKLAVANFPGL